MPFFFDHYPYTNFHNVNLDWVLQAVKAWGALVEENNIKFINLEQAMNTFRASLIGDWSTFQDATEQEINSFEIWTQTYLQNLDITDEINTKLDDMLSSGALSPYFAPYIQTDVSEWLQNNITPTTPAIDASLTISGAGADAAVTGKRINGLTVDLDDYTLDIDATTIVRNWTDGFYYNLTSSATTVDVTTPDVSNANYASAYIPCVAGDVFYITSTGASGAKNWGFISADASNNKVAIASTYTLKNAKVIAPQRSAYAVFNVDKREPYLIVKGNSINNRTTILENKLQVINGLTDDAIIRITDLAGGYYITNTGNFVVDSNYRSSIGLIPIDSRFHGQIFKSNMSRNVHILCYDSNKTFLRTCTAFYDTPSRAITGVIQPDTAYIALSYSGTPDYLEIERITNQDIFEYPYSNTAYITNMWMTDSGNFSEVNNMDCFLMADIKATDRYYSNATGVTVIGCFDNTGTFLGLATYTDIDKHGRIYTPLVNTAYMWFNVAHNKTHGNYSSVAYKVTKDKKVLCIGDSITYLDGSTNTNYDSASLYLGYQKVIQKAGYETVSAGYSGYTYATNVMDGSTIVFSIYNKIVTEQYDVSGYDYILLSAGSNDDLYGVTIGAVPNDYQNHNYNTDTTAGALAGIIKYIRDNNPTAKIILCTILKSQATRRPFVESSLYAEMIRQMANFASCYLCDNYQNYNVQPYSNGWDLFFYDGSHPNRVGMERLGKLMLDAIIAS